MSDDELPSSLQALLDVERQAAGPSAEVKARVLERLEQTLGLNGGPGSDGNDGGHGSGGDPGAGSSSTGSGATSSASASSAGIVPATLSGKLAVGGGLTLAGLGLVVGVALGVLQGERELTTTPATNLGDAVTAEQSSAPAVADAAKEPAEDSFVIDEEAIRVRSAPARPRPARSAQRASTLADEQPLLDKARAALAAGDTKAANAALREHARTFPRGHLSEERSALEVLALARAGRHDDAARAAAVFRGRWPNSLHLATVEAALAAGR